MGASASLTAAYPIELHEEMREAYAKFKAEGSDDDKTMQQLKEMFEARIEEAKKASKDESPVSLVEVVPAKGSPMKVTEVSPAKSGPSKRGSRARRQSFSPEAVLPSRSSPQKPMEVISESASVPALAATSDVTGIIPINPVEMMEALNIANKDSWDSVSEQPVCLICSMTFPSQTKLDRHVKYSSMHATALKKQEIANAEPTEEQPEAKRVEQVEGHDYKLLYSGTKFFWRTKDNIDIHIYLHNLSNCVEVIPFDVERHKELNRSYLEHFILLSAIEQDAVEKVEERKEKLKQAKKKDKNNKEVLPSDDVLLEEAKRVVLVSHLLDRLQIQAGPPKQLVYVTNSFDHVAASSNAITGEMHVVQKPALLEEPPSILEPVSLTRRRRSNAEDVREATARVNSTIHSVKSATGKAEKITELLFSSTGELNNIAKRMAQIRSMNYSKARLRWIDAINRVGIHYLVQRNSGLILAFEARKKGWVGFSGPNVNWAQACKAGIAKYKKELPNEGKCFFPDCKCYENVSSPSIKSGRKQSFLNTAADNEKRRVRNLVKAHEV